MEESIKNLIDFHQKAEKLKTTTRHSWLSGSDRQESTAEHSWMLCLLAMVVCPKIEPKVDLLKVLKMLVIHDLAESVTGDIPSFEISVRQENKYESEKKALLDITKTLPEDNIREIISLWEEFEKGETAESRFALSLDKIEAVMQHNLADISTWEQGDFDAQPYYKNHLFDFNSFMRRWKDSVDIQSMEKIVEAKAEGKVDASHLEKYKRSSGNS